MCIMLSGWTCESIAEGAIEQPSNCQCLSLRICSLLKMDSPAPLTAFVHPSGMGMRSNMPSQQAECSLMCMNSMKLLTTCKQLMGSRVFLLIELTSNMHI